jgi:hypothetical protein
LTEGVLMRRIATLLSAMSLPVLFALIPATAAQATTVTVNAPSCTSGYVGPFFIPKIECTESSSPAGVAVTWTWGYSTYKFTAQETSAFTVGCIGGASYTVSFAYTSGGVAHSSKVADVQCVPDKN